MIPEIQRPIPLVVGVPEAARMLNTSQDKLRELVKADLLATVPNLSNPKRIQIAVCELERFAAAGMTRTSNGNLRVVS